MPTIAQFLVMQKEKINLRPYERLRFPSVVNRNTSDSKVGTNDIGRKNQTRRRF